MYERGDEAATEAGRWLAYAREDLAGAEAFLNLPDVVPRIACFHAGQAAESGPSRLGIRGIYRRRAWKRPVLR